MLTSETLWPRVRAPARFRVRPKDSKGGSAGEKRRDDYGPLQGGGGLWHRRVWPSPNCGLLLLNVAMFVFSANSFQVLTRLKPPNPIQQPLDRLRCMQYQGEGSTGEMDGTAGENTWKPNG